MLVYSSFGPNPRALRMFLAEKNLELPSKELDILGGENRREPYTTLNPGGQIPALELDDKTVIAETVPIFELLEEMHPAPALIGTNFKERAEARQWQRRIEQKITENLYNGFRFAEGLQLFKDRVRCSPESAPWLKQCTQDGLAWLDGLLGSKPYLAGDRFTIGDIILYCALDFGVSVGQAVPASLPNVSAWYQRVADRPSAKASLHAASAQIGMRG